MFSGSVHLTHHKKKTFSGGSEGSPAKSISPNSELSHVLSQDPALAEESNPFSRDLSICSGMHTLIFHFLGVHLDFLFRASSFFGCPYLSDVYRLPCFGFPFWDSFSAFPVSLPLKLELTP